MSWPIFGTNFSFTCQKTPVAAPTFISSTVRAATLAQNPFVHVKVHKISEHFVFALGARTERPFDRRGFRFFGGALKVQGADKPREFGRGRRRASNTKVTEA